MVQTAANFSGSIPEYYDSCLGPAWFEPFADDLVRRLPPRPPGDMLEVACGTGIVTQRLRERLDPEVRLVATDLSGGMLDYARRKLVERGGIEWREADAMALPFEAGAFGTVVCAFGLMFVPDRAAALREMRRVLAEGGTLLFNVWDRLEENPHAHANARVFDAMFPGDEEMQFAKLPFGMHDLAMLRHLLAGARFREVRIETTRIDVHSPDARTLAIGQIRGTPRSLLIEKRGASLDEVIDRAGAALAQAGGDRPYRSFANAVVVEARAL